MAFDLVSIRTTFGSDRYSAAAKAKAAWGIRLALCVALVTSGVTWHCTRAGNEFAIRLNIAC